MGCVMSDDKIITINEIDRLRDERDSIFRNMESSTNTSERRSLKWAWYIKQAQLGLCYDKINSLPSSEFGGDDE